MTTFSVDSVLMTPGSCVPFRAGRQGLMIFRHVSALLLLHVLLAVAVHASVDLQGPIRIPGIYEESDHDDVAGVIVSDTAATSGVSAFGWSVRPSFMRIRARDAAGPWPALTRESVPAPPRFPPPSYAAAPSRPTHRQVDSSGGRRWSA